MKKHNKNRKGFTLVEMLLSLAIICLIGGVIAGLCVGIANSFITTYNVDDAADYAMLYAKGFENSFLSATQGTAASAGKVYQWKISKDGTSVPYLVCIHDSTSERVFEPRFLGTTNTSSKWDVHMFYYYDSTSENVYYRIFIKDNYSRTKYTYNYDGSFWVPRFSDRATNSGAAARSINVLTSGDSLPMTAKTFTDDYHYTSAELAKVQGFLQADDNVTYYSVIQYNAG